MSFNGAMHNQLHFMYNQSAIFLFSTTFLLYSFIAPQTYSIIS